MLHLVIFLISTFLLTIRTLSVSIKIVSFYEDYIRNFVQEPVDLIPRIWFKYLVFIGYFIYKLNKSRRHYHIYHTYPKYKKLCKLMHLYNNNLSIIDKFFYSIFVTYGKIVQSPHYKIFVILGSFSLICCRLFNIYDPLILTTALLIGLLRIIESLIKFFLILLKNKETFFRQTFEFLRIRFTSMEALLLTHFVNFWTTINLIIWLFFLAINLNTITLQTEHYKYIIDFLYKLL